MRASIAALLPTLVGCLTRLTRLDAGRGKAVAADLSFGPTGDTFVGYVQSGVGGSVGRIVRVTLPP